MVGIVGLYPSETTLGSREQTSIRVNLADCSRWTYGMVIKEGLAMRTVSVAEAKARLASLLQAAEAGEKIVVTRRGKAIVEFKAIENEVDSVDPHGLKWLTERRSRLPMMQDDSALLLRSMRDEGDH
jgi:antitoxin (DNA-binding transcriptional repressor) of toxin-antitoxin stability system